MNFENGFTLDETEIAAAKIVVVDDDSLVTTSLCSFLELELDVEPIFFNVSTEAAEFVKTEEFDLIISDFLMPDLDGIRLLNEARNARPRAPRILLTGYADKENAIKAINEVRLFQYLEKPWDNEQLKNVVINGLERHHLMRTIEKHVDALAETQRDLAGLKKALVRAFA